MDWFILGLNYPIRNKLINKQFNSFIDALNAAKEIEEVRAKPRFNKFSYRNYAPSYSRNNGGSSPGSLNNTQSGPKSNSNSGFNTRTGSSSNISTIDRRGQMLCYACGEPGHMAKNCRNRTANTPRDVDQKN